MCVCVYLVFYLYIYIIISTQMLYTSLAVTADSSSTLLPFLSDFVNV